MMAIPVQRFCRQCGREITEDYGFCTACGCTYTDTPPAPYFPGMDPSEDPQKVEQARAQYQNYAAEFQKNIMENQRSVTMMMLATWVVMSTMFVLTSIAYSSIDIFSDNVGLRIAVFASSDILALGSLLLCLKRRKANIALALCLAASVIPIALLYGANSLYGFYFTLCGLLTSLRLRNSRSTFTD